MEDRKPAWATGGSEEFAKGLRLSLFFHGVFFAWAITMQIIDFGGKGAERDEALKRAKLAKSAIRVDVVDLPSMKLEELAKIDPTLEPVKGAKSSEEPAPVPETPKPSKDAMTAPTDSKNPVKKPTKEAPSKVQDIRERLRADARRNALMAKLKGEGAGQGRPVLGGNQLSEGYSVTGDVAKDGDVYIGKVKARLLKNWNVPGWMESAKLNARVLVKIAPDGRVVSKQFLAKSGNGEFDSYVDRAIEGSNPFPNPPESLRREYLEEGFELGFPK